MSVYKDEKTGKWYALAWYHDWKGEGRQKCKRGFETKKDAQDWERTFLEQNAADMDMVSDFDLLRRICHAPPAKNRGCHRLRSA